MLKNIGSKAKGKAGRSKGKAQQAPAAQQQEQQAEAPPPAKRPRRGAAAADGNQAAAAGSPGSAAAEAAAASGSQQPVDKAAVQAQVGGGQAPLGSVCWAGAEDRPSVCSMGTVACPALNPASHGLPSTPAAGGHAGPAGGAALGAAPAPRRAGRRAAGAWGMAGTQVEVGAGLGRLEQLGTAAAIDHACSVQRDLQYNTVCGCVRTFGGAALQMRRSRRRAGVDVDEEVYIDVKGECWWYSNMPFSALCAGGGALRG